MNLIKREGFEPHSTYAEIAVLESPSGPEIWSPAVKVGIYQQVDDLTIWLVMRGEVYVLDTSVPEAELYPEEQD